jgi:hypothetical protein
MWHTLGGISRKHSLLFAGHPDHGIADAVFGPPQRGKAGNKARLPLSARRYCAGERPIGKGHSPRFEIASR